MPDNPAPPSMPPASESPEWLADAVNHEMTLWAVEHLAASQGVAVPAEAAREAVNYAYRNAGGPVVVEMWCHRLRTASTAVGIHLSVVKV